MAPHPADRRASILRLSTHEEFADWRRAAKAQQTKLLQRVAAATTPRARKKAVARVLASRNSQWLAYVNTVSDVFRGKARRERRERAMPRVTDVWEYWQDLNARTSIHERFSQLNCPKRNGGTRTTFSFGLRQRTRQRLVRVALEAAFDGAFMLQGQYSVRSPARLIAQVREALADPTLTAGAVIDVKSYFDSINHDYLFETLPLNREVIANTVLAHMRTDGPTHRADAAEHAVGPNTTTSIDHGRPCRQSTSRRGLPQGSACSPIIAYGILEQTLSRPAQGAVCFQWGDDIMLLGRSHGEIDALVSAFRCALERSPAGPFELGRISIGPVAEGLQFIGVEFRRTAAGIRVNTATSSREAFFEKALDKAREDLENGLPECPKATDYILSRTWNSPADDAMELEVEANARIVRKFDLPV